MKKQIKERNKILLSYNLINKFYAKIIEKKWEFLIILKKIKLYYLFRKIYRKIINR